MARSDRQLRFTNPVARTRTLSNEQILHLIAHALGDADNAWTLADAAAGAGLHPATLIKRFGSRRGLLIALSRRWVDNIPTAPTTEDAHRELLTWIESLSTSDTTGDQMLTRLDMLVEDLRDPELRVLLHHGWQRNIDYLSALIDRAQRDGRMRAGTSPASVVEVDPPFSATDVDSIGSHLQGHLPGQVSHLVQGAPRPHPGATGGNAGDQAIDNDVPAR